VEGNRITVIFKIFGRGTKLLSERKIGEVLDLLGPLGNVFSGWNEKYVPILVGGGVGLAPILNLFKECQKYKIHSNLILGARTGREHFMAHDPSNGIYLTTDDGTLGISGTVIPTLKNVFSDVDNPMVYACGPLPMLKAVQDFVIQNKIPTQLSVESYMGCGTGLCQGCVIKKRNIKAKTHSYHERYSLVCMDGPVYSADEVCFD
jgi:dihydroorotate dehydrogenase electron transfer subunit